MLIVQVLINTAAHHRGLMMCDEKGYDDKIGEDSVCEWQLLVVVFMIIIFHFNGYRSY
jgi:hypothetical protein